MTTTMHPTLAVLAMAAPPDGGGSPLSMLVFMGAMFAILYFVMVLPMKRRQKKVRQFLDALKVGDRVVTSGGIYGTVVKIADRSVKLQVADKVNIEISKAAIAGLQGQDPVVPDNTQA
jgi:preprotein translocase subunit YajC